MRYLSGVRAEQSQPNGMEGNIGSGDAQHISTAQGAGKAQKEAPDQAYSLEHKRFLQYKRK